MHQAYWPEFEIECLTAACILHTMKHDFWMASFNEQNLNTYTRGHLSSTPLSVRPIPVETHSQLF